MKKSFNRKLLCASALIAGTMGASAGWAQDATAPAAEDPAAYEAAPGEILVTARKQSEALKDVPVTINVLQGEQLARKSITSGFDLNGVVPGLQVIYGQGGNSTPRIRGLGSNSAVFSIEPATALFLDGVYAMHPRDLITPFYDLDRIEVVKGTQSTILGKNTTLGAVTFTSRRPGKDFAYNMSVGHEFRFDSTRIEAAVDVPLSDTLQVRVAGLYSREGGYVKNRFYQDKEPERTFASGRIIANWQPIDALDVTLLYQHEDYREKGQWLVFVRDTPTGLFAGLAARQGQTDFTIDPAVSYNGSPNGRPYDRQKGDRATVIANYDLGGVTLTSQSAYVNWDVNLVSDLDFTAGRLINFGVGEPNKFFSQELRIATPTANRLNVLAGIYYLWNRWSIDQKIDTYAPYPVTGAISQFHKQDVSAYSAFGQGTFAVTDALKVTGGLRITRETKDATFYRTLDRPGNIGGPFAPFATRYQSHNETNLDWSSSVQYRFSPNAMVYASAGSGSKSGGFQTLMSNPNLVEFQGEKAMSVELGTKLRVLRTLNLDIALYQTKVDGYQFNINTALGNTINNVDIRSRGFDGSFDWRPSRYVQFNGGLVYADAKILEAFPGAVAGDQLFRSPKWSGNFGANFTLPVRDKLTVTANPSVQFASKQFLQLPSANGPIQEGNAIVDFRLALANDAAGWELAGLVKNLTNKRTIGFATSTMLVADAYYGTMTPPIQFMLQFKIKG